MSRRTIVLSQRSTGTTEPARNPIGCGVLSKDKPNSSEIQQEHTKVVEAAGGQALREVRGKQEASEEGEEEVVAVAGQGVAGAADATAAQQNLRNTFTRCRHQFYCLKNATRRSCRRQGSRMLVVSFHYVCDINKMGFLKIFK